MAKDVNLMIEGLKSCQVRLGQAERLAALGDLSGHGPRAMSLSEKGMER